MNQQILTAIFLVGAGLLMFRIRGWTHRWIGFMLISAGLSNFANNITYVLWLMMLCALGAVAILEEPEKKSK